MFRTLRFALRDFQIPPNLRTPQAPTGSSFGDLTSAAEADEMELQAEQNCRIEPAPGASARRTAAHHRKLALDLGSCLNSQQWWVVTVAFGVPGFPSGSPAAAGSPAGFTIRIESNRDGFRAVESHLVGRCQYRPWRARDDRWRCQHVLLIADGSESRCFPSAEVVALFLVRSIPAPRPNNASVLDSPSSGSRLSHAK